MAVVVPAGVNVAVVPSGILPPDILIWGVLFTPTTPVSAEPLWLPSVYTLVTLELERELELIVALEDEIELQLGPTP